MQTSPVKRVLAERSFSVKLDTFHMNRKRRGKTEWPNFHPGAMKVVKKNWRTTVFSLFLRGLRETRTRRKEQSWRRPRKKFYFLNSMSYLNLGQTAEIYTLSLRSNGPVKTHFKEEEGIISNGENWKWVFYCFVLPSPSCSSKLLGCSN